MIAFCCKIYASLAKMLRPKANNLPLNDFVVVCGCLLRQNYAVLCYEWKRRMEIYANQDDLKQKECNHF